MLTAVTLQEPPVARAQLTFISDRNPGFYGVYAVDVLCWDAKANCFAAPKLLFELREHIFSIAWSPDGHHVALEIIHQDGTSDIVLAEANGEELTPLTIAGSSNSFPAWSPDGSQISFTFTASPSPSQLLVARLDKNNIKEIVLPANFGDVLQSAWSPDGEHIAISAHGASEFPAQIYTLSPDGTNISKVTDLESGHGSFEPAYSPDGLQIAFSGNKLSGDSFWTDIYVVSLQTGQVVTVTSDSDTDLTPVWAPSESWLAFASNKTQNYDIYVVRPKGANRLNISNNLAKDISPAWRVITN